MPATSRATVSASPAGDSGNTWPKPTVVMVMTVM